MRKNLYGTTGVFAFALAFGFLFITVCSDLVGFLVDEGFTLYGAKRVLAGEVPYRDFFFLWSPGVLYLHAAAQNWLSENIMMGRFAQLLAWAFIPVAAYKICLEIFLLSKRDAWLCALLCVLWGFSLWNMPYASWYAISAALAAFLLSEKYAWRAGVLFALSFWMKQNVGLLSLCGLLLAFFFTKERKKALQILGGFVLGVLPGIFYFFIKGAFGAFFSQVLLFPFTYKNVMFKGIAWSDITLARAAWYFSVFAVWPAVVGLLLIANGSQKKKIFYFLSFAIGAFLQLYPRTDFQHVLFSFPLVAPIVLYCCSKWKFCYVFLVCMLLGGGWENLALLKERVFPERRVFGLNVSGEKAEVLLEVEQLIQELKNRNGLRSGDPVLLYPHMETLYYLSGFENPTPHNQFLPSYVEFFGESQEQVLPRFEAAGGKYIIYTRKSGLEPASEKVFSSIKNDYKEVRRYPALFSVYEKKSVLKTEP